MKKSTKGALAASAAGILLLGGAGSLAYWTADGDAEGGSVTAGELKLTDGDCTGGWVYADGSASAGDPVTLFVPGDKITKDCTFDLVATGDNLAATIDVPATVPVTDTPDGTTLTATADATFSIASGSPVVERDLDDADTVTSADDGGTITATFVVTIPFGNETTINANDTQEVLAELDTLTVSLTQVDPNL
ncbi:MAG: hypothetical protein JWP31_1125 [Aeromicrobium sp.]|nr:hypothetical protein [Aeromicrobium sp.]